MDQNGSYKALGYIEAIRARPGMYIGSTETADHLATEIIDNMLDEVANGYANDCSLNISDGALWVSDNGRGIEVYNMQLSDGRIEDSVVALCTITHTGSKFDTDDYKTLIGMHGVGLVAVNALSEWVVINTRDRKDKLKYHNYVFRNGELYSKQNYLDYPNDNNWSTIIGFKPNPIYFKNVDFNIRGFAERLLLAQSKYENVLFNINGKNLPKISFIDYIRTQLQLKADDLLYELSYINQTDNKWNGSIKCFITYTDNSDTIILGDVNIRSCDGTYLNSFQTLLKNIIFEKVEKKFKDISPNILTYGLRLYISLTVPEPQFDSQTKTRMTLNVKNILVDPLESQIRWFIEQNGILQTIINHIETKLKQNLVSKVTKSTKNKRVSSGNKVKDAVKIPAETLYILEGDSALGTLKPIRDTKKEGIFPLKGKVLNVETNSIDKLEKNKEIKDLLEVLGPKNSRRYRNIKILADADSDGHHIVVLCVLLIQKLAPDYIESGNLSIILPPLYGAEKGNKFIPIYNFNNVKIYEEKGYNIQRFKGLGEMSSKKLKQCLDSGIEYKIEFPKSKDELDIIINIVTNTDLKRAIMNDERCNINKVFELATQKQ